MAAYASCQHGRESSHKLAWAGLAVLFVLLLVFRIMNAEAMIREYFRACLWAAGDYERRRDFQRPIVAGLILVAGFSGLWWITLIYRSLTDRRNLAVLLALSAGAGMVVLLAMRLVSLHAIDALLYGPAKLNWVADAGLSCIVASAAIYYSKVFRVAG